jgi:digeranylgeranylglycerophospholipid reductase
MSSYDVAIVGAGPGGLHCAKWAAKKGLKVLLIEKRMDVSKVTRYCSEHLILEDGYNGDKLIVEPGAEPNEIGIIPETTHKIKSTEFGWEVDYTGGLCIKNEKFYYSPDIKHYAYFAWEDMSPYAYKYDKGALLGGLLKEVLELGVEYRNGTICYQATDSPSGVTLKCVSQGKKHTVSAKKLVAADGCASQVGLTLGMNTDRMDLAYAPVLALYMSGVKEQDVKHWSGYWGMCYGSNLAPLMGCGPAEDFELTDLVLLGTPHQTPWEMFEFFTKKSPVAWMFEGSKVERAHSCLVKAYTPAKTPYKGNCLMIGDAAAFVEVQAQGALNCGFWAADALEKELKGEPGFEEYTKTWLERLEFNGDGMKQVTQGYGLVPYYTDEEMVYIFSLLDGVRMPGNYSQYASPRLLWTEIHRHDDKIQRERPEIWEKMEKSAQRTFRDNMEEGAQ